MKSKKILITGGAGSIGSELVRQLAINYDNNVIYVLDIDETRMFDIVEELKQKGFNVSGRIGDVCSSQTLEDVFEEFKPEVVFHAAARKHVTPCEEHPEEAVQTNILGTMNVIRFAKRYKVEKFVNISTDKVVNANCIMGLTKKFTEFVTKKNGYVSVRFGNVLGSRGSVIPIWQRQMDGKEPLTVTHEDMTRYFMTIPQACELVIHAADTASPGTTMIMDMGQPVKVLDVAQKVIQEMNYDGGVKMIGLRPGESMDEKLMTEEEMKVATKVGKFWVL